MNAYLVILSLAVLVVVLTLLLEIYRQERRLRSYQEMPETEGGPVYDFGDDPAITEASDARSRMVG